MTVTNEEIQKDLFFQIMNLSDMRTDPSIDDIMIFKITYSV